MRIGALEAEPQALAPAAALLLLLLLLLQAARTLTESATALNAITFLVITFLENQGCSALTPGSSFLVNQDSSGSSPSDTSACSLSRFIPADSASWAMNAAKSTSP